MNHDLGKKHPLLVWTTLRAGDVVSLEGPDIHKHVGTVETWTNDGLIIWIRADLNERKMFHFRECDSILVVG